MTRSSAYDVELTTAPPPDWHERIPHAVQGVRYAEAMRGMGMTPLFVQHGPHTALVQVRDPLGRGGSPLARAYVYTGHEDGAFVGAVLRALRQRGVPFVRFGNTMWGVEREEALVVNGAPAYARHTFHIDLTQGEAELRRSIAGVARKIRKAESSGVEVSECSTPEELAAYVQMCRETNERILDREGSIAIFPASFYEELFRERPGAGARPVLLLARREGRIIAGNLFFVQGDTMLYFQGASTRDRSETPYQAPAAIFNRAILMAREHGQRVFDFGGCTPGLDPSDSRYGVYEYKKRWGGREVVFYNADVVLSPLNYRIQETAGKVLWKHLHPAYFRAVGWLRRR